MIGSRIKPGTTKRCLSSVIPAKAGIHSSFVVTTENGCYAKKKSKRIIIGTMSGQAGQSSASLGIKQKLHTWEFIPVYPEYPIDTRKEYHGYFRLDPRLRGDDVWGRLSLREG